MLHPNCLRYLLIRLDPWLRRALCLYLRRLSPTVRQFRGAHSVERAEAEALRSPIVGSRAPRVAVLMQRARLHLLVAHLVAARTAADIVRPFLL